VPLDDTADGWDIARAVACAPGCGEWPEWLSKVTSLEVRELGAEALSDAVGALASHEAAPRLLGSWRWSVTHRRIRRSRLKKASVPASSSTGLPKALRRRFRVRPGSRHERAVPDPARGMSGYIAGTIRRCGRRGRRWAASGDHGDSIGASFGTGTGGEYPSRHGARGTPHGPSSARPPANSSTHERDYRNDLRGTLAGRRFVSPSLRDVSG
jgi:hypothetical protein